MRCAACTFSTERLAVAEWRSASPPWTEDRRIEVVCALLTEPVTRTLPPPWRGSYDATRARQWIGERDAEGTTLAVVERATGEAIGLVILFETSEPAGVEVRLGYLLAETAWGKGFATELVRGLVDWCRGTDGIASLAGGVEHGNVASARVLEKAGFELADDRGEEQLFRVVLRPGAGQSP